MARRTPTRTGRSGEALKKTEAVETLFVGFNEALPAGEHL